MAEYDTPRFDAETGNDERPAVRTRSFPDVLTLVVGLLTIAMALAALVGDVPDLSGFDSRWLLAAGGAIIGVLLLVGSLRRKP